MESLKQNIVNIIRWKTKDLCLLLVFYLLHYLLDFFHPFLWLVHWLSHLLVTDLLWSTSLYAGDKDGEEKSWPRSSGTLGLGSPRSFAGKEILDAIPRLWGPGYMGLLGKGIRGPLRCGLACCLAWGDRCCTLGWGFPQFIGSIKVPTKMKGNRNREKVSQKKEKVREVK